MQAQNRGLRLARTPPEFRMSGTAALPWGREIALYIIKQEERFSGVDQCMNPVKVYALPCLARPCSLDYLLQRLFRRKKTERS